MSNFNIDDKVMYLGSKAVIKTLPLPNAAYIQLEDTLEYVFVHRDTLVPVTETEANSSDTQVDEVTRLRHRISELESELVSVRAVFVDQYRAACAMLNGLKEIEQIAGNPSAHFLELMDKGLTKDVGYSDWLAITFYNIADKAIKDALKFNPSSSRQSSEQ